MLKLFKKIFKKEVVNYLDNPMIKKQMSREDKENIFWFSITEEEFFQNLHKYGVALDVNDTKINKENITKLVDKFFGKDYMIADPLSYHQGLSYFCDGILYRQSKKYRDEWKAYKEYLAKNK